MRNQRLILRVIPFAAMLALLPSCKKDMDDDKDLAKVEDLSVGPSPDLTGGAMDLTSNADLKGAPDPRMSFFITSQTGSANLGGLAGADARCQRLATAVGLGGKKWAAYLSATAEGGNPAVNARDRIGTGPWYNFAGVKIADDVNGLHVDAVNINKMTGLDEKGQAVPGRGDMPNQHDILTGSTMDGRLNGMATCANWTSEAAMMPPNAAVGHFDRVGGGMNPMSWNFAHTSSGCSAAVLVSTGGAGRFYCFATN